MYDVKHRKDRKRQSMQNEVGVYVDAVENVEDEEISDRKREGERKGMK